jgi:hypothetical protein
MMFLDVDRSRKGTLRVRKRDMANFGPARTDPKFNPSISITLTPKGCPQSFATGQFLERPVPRSAARSIAEV